MNLIQGDIIRLDNRKYRFIGWYKGIILENLLTGEHSTSSPRDFDRALKIPEDQIKDDLGHFLLIPSQSNIKRDIKP